MAKITLNYEQAHDFVEKNKKEGFYWDGYTIVRWAPSKNGYMDPKGMFKNNKWGFANRYRMKTDGTWDVSDKYAQFI